MKKLEKTNYSGSIKTAELVEAQIIARFGKDEAKKYNPARNCRTLFQWNKNGYHVKAGQKAIKSYIMITFKNKKGEEEKRKKYINLFYIKQVIKI